MSEQFPGWRFDAKNARRGLDAPRVAPDGRETVPNAGTAFLWGVVALGLLGLCEGTLAWVALRWAASLGWVESPEWAPVVGIALAVTYLRGIDRAVFRRPTEGE